MSRYVDLVSMFVLCCVVCVLCVCVCVVFFVFFFQAEDGIRDLVRSRGLGDVYKRQISSHVVPCWGPAGRLVQQPSPVVRSVAHRPACRAFAGASCVARCPSLLAVSYTHLTLPTSDLG